MKAKLVKEHIDDYRPYASLNSGDVVDMEYDDWRAKGMIKSINAPMNTAMVEIVESNDEEDIGTTEEIDLMMVNVTLSESYES